mgnify:CR=1 FL=1
MPYVRCPPGVDMRIRIIEALCENCGPLKHRGTDPLPIEMELEPIRDRTHMIICGILICGICRSEVLIATEPVDTLAPTGLG